MVHNSNYPTGIPVVPYVVPAGRMSIYNNIHTQGLTTVGHTIRNTASGKRYFSARPGPNINNNQIQLILDEGDEVELWNEEVDDVSVCGSFLEFDKTSLNGGQYVILRGTNDDFPLSLTVPNGFSARLAPFNDWLQAISFFRQETRPYPAKNATIIVGKIGRP